MFEKTGKSIGIDLGLKKLATLSNGHEITNPNLKKEDKMIKKIPEKIIQTKIQKQKLPKNTKKILQMAKPKKQQNTKHIPPLKQTPS